MKPIISESFKEFLTQKKSKVARILNSCFDNPTSLLLTDKEINYITFRADGTISYLPKGSEHVVCEDGRWSRQNRQTGKPSKIIKKIMNPHLLSLFKDKDFEDFHNLYKAAGESDYEFILRSNQDIPDVYNMSYEDSGTLGGSCMRGNGHYLRIYEECEALQILTLINKHTGVLHGRALVWTFSDMVFMDRIYVSDDYMYNLFFLYAEDRGWYRKEYYNTYYEKTKLVSPDGKRLDRCLVINTPTDFRAYPYIDTMSYGGEGYLTNYKEEGDIYIYDCTNGERTEEREEEEDAHEGQTYCECDDTWYDDDDVRFIDRGCRAGEYAHYDDVIEIDGYYFHKDDERIIWINDDPYDKESDKVIYSYTGDYILESEAVFIQSLSSYIHYSDAVAIEGNYYSKEDCYFDEVVNKYFLKEIIEA